MYNGSINTGDSSDLNILKQQAELISVINSKLSEFTGLRGTIADVLGIFKSEKSNVAEMADAIGRTVSAGNELNTVSQLGATLLSKLSSNTTLYSAATTIAEKAQKALSMSVGNASTAISAAIVVITAVVAAISSFVKWINRTNEAGEAAKTSAENLVAAQEELAQSAIDSSAAYAQTTASLQAAGASAGDMTARLAELQANTQRTNAEDQEMAQIISDLTGRYTGLTSMIDENTGALTGNADQWNAVIDAQLGYEQAQAAMARSTELTEQATEAQLNLATAQQMVSDNETKIAENAERRNELEAEATQVYTQLTDGSQRTAEEMAALQQRYNDLQDQTESLRLENNGLRDANKTLQKGMGELSDTRRAPDPGAAGPGGAGTAANPGYT